MAGRFSTESKRRPEKLDLKIIKLLDRNQPCDSFYSREHSELTTIPDNELSKKIQGSLVGLAVGDALGASVEFRPHAYLVQYPVENMQSGGTWGLQAGQWTDDTSMALCLAASLIVKGKFDSYDQFVRYRRWLKEGYMSSTGKCFDIGKSTREAITEFESVYQKIEKKLDKEKITREDSRHDNRIEELIREDNIKLKFGKRDAAGNGPLMRLAPIPCFFHRSYNDVRKHIEEATQLTHGDPAAIEACQFYAGLIWYALNGTSKKELLDKFFYQKTLRLELRTAVKEVAEGSYKTKKDGYADGIRGKGYIVDALEAALWAFYYDDNKFGTGVLNAVNLGDDTDTTAAIYGQFAGAVYGIDAIPKRWVDQLYKGEFIIAVARTLYIVGNNFIENKQKSDWSNTESQKDYGNGSYTPKFHDPNSGKSDSKPSDHPDQHTNTNNTRQSSPAIKTTAAKKPKVEDQNLDALKPRPHVLPEN